MVLYNSPMDQAVLQDRFILFIALWGVLVACAAVLFSRQGNTPLKRKMVPWFAGAFGVIFLAMTQAVGLPPEALIIAVPLVAFTLYRNVRAIRFCPKCGAYNLSSTAITVKFCRSCGQSLEKTTL
jgi:membrane associated rhomboid family serine protease